MHQNLKQDFSLEKHIFNSKKYCIISNFKIVIRESPTKIATSILLSFISLLKFLGSNIVNSEFVVFFFTRVVKRVLLTKDSRFEIKKIYKV